MDSLTLVLIGWCSVVVTIELSMWLLFSGKFRPMCLPHEEHTAALCRVHSVGVLRIFALLHTAVLCTAVILAHLWLW